MRRWLISASAFALALALMGQPSASGQALGPGETGEFTSDGYRVRDFAPEKPTERAVYHDSVPRFMVRFDDGRLGQYTQGHIQAFLRRGIPATLALNSGTISTSPSRMTWEQIRDLQEFARAHGTVLHIMQHTNNNMEAPFTLTHDELVAEFSTDLIFQETGYRVRAAVLPGDAARKEWFSRNLDYATAVGDSLGIWTWDIGTANTDSVSYVSNAPSFVEFDTYASQTANSNFSVQAMARPNMGINRWEIPSRTMDLGVLVVERVASDLPEDFAINVSMDLGPRGQRYGYEFETGVKPPRTAGWTLTGNGANANASGIYRKTWAAWYTEALSENYGLVVAIHDSAATPVTTPVTGISNAEYIAGAFSPEHIAWTLAMLREKGHIKIVGPEEYARWAMGKYAVGVDLINNPRCLIPQFDIGDTLGATSEYPYIRGLGRVNVNNSGQTNAIYQVYNLQVEQTGNVAKYVRRTSAGTADNPYYAIGDSVTGSHGRKGGILLRADVAGVAPERLGIVFSNMRPGRYRYSMDIRPGTGVNPVIEELHTAYRFKFHKITASATAGFAEAYRDTMISWQWRDQSDVINPPAFSENKWSSYAIPIYLPDFPLGETLAGANYGSTSEAVGVRLFKPYADGAGATSEGLFAHGAWAWSLKFAANGALSVSNPRLIWLGDD